MTTWEAIQQLETKDLQRLHDTLYRSIAAIFDNIKGNGLSSPAWLDQATEDVKAMNAELWARRQSGKLAENAFLAL